MNPTIRIHIDHIVMHGIDIPPSQRDRLTSSIKAELTQFLTQQLASGQPLSDRFSTHPTIPAISIELSPHSTPDTASMGYQIAQTIHDQLVN